MFKNQDVKIKAEKIDHQPIYTKWNVKASSLGQKKMIPMEIRISIKK